MEIVIAFVGGLLALVGGGALFEFASVQRDRRRYKTPPGDLIDVGGYRLHIRRTGTRTADQPVVVLDAGVGSNSIDWAIVQPRIAEFAQVVSYDRAGYGWSDAGPEPRTTERIVSELHALLHNAEVEPPYLMVGHSFGGIHIRAFAEAYPDEVVGLVLVDSSHPDVLAERDTKPEIRRLRNVGRLQRVGFMRLMLPRILGRADFMPNEAAKKRYLTFTLLDSHNNLREAQPLFETGIELPDEVDMPVTVISRQPDEDLAGERRWHEYQQDLATLSPTARHIISEKTNHFIQLADPDIIVEAVRQMITQAKEVEPRTDVADLSE